MGKATAMQITTEKTACRTLHCNSFNYEVRHDS